MTEPKGRAIQSFLQQIATRIRNAHVEDAQDWLDHGEWGLAIDVIADGRFEASVTLTLQERQAFLALVRSIGCPIDKFAFLKLGS